MAVIIFSILGALVLFLYSLSNLSTSFNELLGEKVKKWMALTTRNVFFSLITGIVATTVLNSSSVVIILTILFINSGALTFRNSMGIILGANIGTTVSSQLIALNIGMYSPILLAVGLIGLFLKLNNLHWTKVFEATFFLGLLFFSLFLMEHSVEPLKNQPFFAEWMMHLENPLSGVFAGAVVTVILQSSSATVGIAIVLAKKAAISLTASIAVMMGAELGTCADTLLATIKGSRASLKAGLFHLFFNLFSILVGVIFFVPFVRLVQWYSGEASLQTMVANAHVGFNIMGVLIAVWFLPFFEKLLNKMIPEKTHKS
jgi:phosphate:Na+ symporter